MKKIWEKFAVIINIVLVLSVYLFFYLVFWKDWNFIEKLGLLEKVGEINIHSDGTIFWGLIVPGLVYLIMFIVILVVVGLPSLLIWNIFKDLLLKKKKK
jgi:hypothetical protein|tara:strand:+ start:267 stop:563 length:297 start_codon:yes stop_codon:yes gene_type:complete